MCVRIGDYYTPDENKYFIVCLLFGVIHKHAKVRELVKVCRRFYKLHRKLLMDGCRPHRSQKIHWVMCEKRLTSQVRADDVQRRGERWRTTYETFELTDFNSLVKLKIKVSKTLSEQFTSVSPPVVHHNQLLLFLTWLLCKPRHKFTAGSL